MSCVLHLPSAFELPVDISISLGVGSAGLTAGTYMNHLVAVWALEPCVGSKSLLLACLSID
jgi:hypothetical protein